MNQRNSEKKSRRGDHERPEKPDKPDRDDDSDRPKPSRKLPEKLLKIDYPTYPLTLPVSKQEVSFRPFTVQEQVSLMTSAETAFSNNTDTADSEKIIYTAILSAIQSCTRVKNARQLPIVDVLLLFLNIRAKSAGEIVELNFKCPKCEKEMIRHDMNLLDVKVKVPNRVNKITISENRGLVLKDLSISTLIQLPPDDSIGHIASSIESIWYEDEVYEAKDYDLDSLKELISNLSSEKTKDIENFFKNDPVIYYEMEYYCKTCKETIREVLDDPKDFFVYAFVTKI